jgi:hypothetical protein
MFLTPQHIQHPGAPRRPRILHCISHHRTLSNNRSNSRVARTRLAARTHPVPRTKVLTRREASQAIRWRSRTRPSCASGARRKPSSCGSPGRTRSRPSDTPDRGRRARRGVRRNKAPVKPGQDATPAKRYAGNGADGPNAGQARHSIDIRFEFSLCACVCVW